MDLNSEENSDTEPCSELLDMIVEDASDGDSSDEDDGDNQEDYEAADNEDNEVNGEKQWQKEKKFKTFSEKVMLVYFFELSKIKKSTTLWNTYSMLKCTLGSFHKVNIGEYKRLIQFLKKKEVGFRKKKSKEFTAAEITEFLNTASDKEFLVEKAVLIIGVCGATRRAEICGLTIDNVIDTGSKFVVTIQHVVKKIPVRRFSIEDDFYTLVKKYVSLRPVPKSPGQKMSNRFFLNYQKSKCTRQAIGINKIGGTPKRIAQFLKLSDANEYTGHCFRRTTEKLLKDVNVDMRSLSRYGEWKSCHVSLEDMNKIFSWITSEIKLKLLPVSPKPVKKFSKPKPKAVDQPTADQSNTEKSVVDLIMDEPVANQPVSHPIVDQPVIEQPIVNEPIIDQPPIEEPITDLSPIDEPMTDDPIIIQSIEASTSKIISQKVSTYISKIKTKRIDYHTYKYSVVEIDRRRLEIVARGWTPLEGTQTVTSLGGFNDYQSAADWAEILDRRKTLDKQNWEFLQRHLENAAVDMDDIEEELEVKEEMTEEEEEEEEEMCL
ncbi:uncharacterized protein LOC123261856 isoform X2 [Cotesia glomerata]|uniref:uncharacterized protein LOC123261856 isoform X2 n=1 Tax=Cotesia glomerata TaxID=32391 RepID=UPI001D034DFF|nr:uncharacterized protein LOC123261856 isoform X2 [Cotesia glomerata]